jgi:DNA-binding SARP family transcriptional activator/tetratricopeptide (TPR) repeat protein
VRVEVALLGGFAVRVDGATVPPDRWNRRQAAALVKVLAMAPRGRVHRDRLADALWPDAGPDAVQPRLYKAAHYARQALHRRDAVVVRDETVALFPTEVLDVDALAFEAAADAALRTGPGREGCEAAIALYPGDLLPDDLNEPWSQEPRNRLRSRYEQLLRAAGRWQDVLRLNPADEQAHVELLRVAVLAGDRAGALRRFEDLERILDQELGVAPGPEAVALRERIMVTPATQARPNHGTVLPGPTLLERDDELASLSRLSRSVLRTGRGGVVLVTGEAGSGKSALTRAFLDRVDQEVVVAIGGCDDLLAPRSLGPFRDMAGTLPGLAAALSGTAQPEDVFPGLLNVFAAAPTVVVVEDVHWADDATLDAVRYLSRRIAGAPMVLLLTFREDDIHATHPLRRILGGLSGSSTRRIDLDPLSVEAVRRLAGVDAAEAAEIHRVTRGNPFFVTEVLEAGGDGVPATVRDAVLARVARLPAAARRLAEHIAVVPTRTERWLAEALAGDQPDAVIHIERSGVISGGPEHVSFRHELARRAIETSLTVGELVQANREVLDVLLRRGPVEPSRVVHHAVRALRTDVLLEYGPIAAADAERAGAHRQAAETLRAVLAHDDRLDQITRASLLTRRAYSLYVVNDYQAALPCAEAAVSMAERSNDAVVLAEALIVLSRIAFFARGPQTARPAAARAVEILQNLGDDARLAAALIELARTHSNLATVGVVAQPDPAVVNHAARALALADRLGRDDLRAQALWYRGSGRLALDDQAGTDDIERAIALAEAETRLEVRVRGYVNAAGSAHRAGRPHEAERYAAAGLRLAADGEFAAGEYRLRLTSAAVSASQGDWDRAIAELLRLVTGPGQPGVMGLLARSLLARLLARRGDPSAHDVLDEAIRDPMSSHDSYVAGPLAVALVEMAWLTGTIEIPPAVWSALAMATDTGHAAVQAELCGYLRRAGHDVAAPHDAPGPWTPALAGRWRQAAAAWNALGERYEYAVEQAWSADDDQARAAGVAVLTDLGATATLARIRTRFPG